MTIGLSTEAVLVERWARSQIGVVWKGNGVSDIKTIREDRSFLNQAMTMRGTFETGESCFIDSLFFKIDKTRVKSCWKRYS